MRMTVRDFVQDVMGQLQPFLKNGQAVEFDLGTEAFYQHDKAEKRTALVGGASDGRLKFYVTMSEAILPTQETLPETLFRD